VPAACQENPFSFGGNLIPSECRARHLTTTLRGKGSLNYKNMKPGMKNYSSK